MATSTKNGTSRNGNISVPDPEVKPKRTRRTYTAKQKLSILAETDQLEQGQIGAYLRRKGLYWSHLTKWRNLREQGQLSSLEPKKRGCQPASPETQRVTKLELENAKLRAKLERAEKIIDVQKKLCELFGLPPAEPT